ncbi:MAG: phosphotransferase family protein [Dehalococcoidia bacterium]
MLEPRIEEFLRSRVPAAEGLAVSALHRIPGGASRETWSFDATWRENGGSVVSRGFILRRDPDASLLESDRDLEFRVMAAARAAGVPVPEMYWLEQDVSWLDRPFFVMERIDGCETSPTKVLMDPRLFAHREKIAQQFVAILARIHNLDWRALDLEFLGVPADESACAIKELDKWEEVVDREALEPQPVLRAAFRWMRRHSPRPAERIVLVHADYRTGNFLCDAEGTIQGILDWEMAHLGDPLDDLGFTVIRPWRWLGNELMCGLMERDDFIRRYEAASGLSVDAESLRFWEVLGNVKLAAIFLTGARSFCEGRTRSPMMAFLGRNVSRLELEIMDLMGV